MALHRRTKVTPAFNMSSMTDIIFLLTIDSLQHIYASADGKEEVEVTLDELGDVLTGNQSEMGDSTNLFVSLYADQSVPYKAIVDVLNVANDNHFKMVLATRPPKSAPGVADEPAAQSDNTISPENTSDQVPTE